MIEISFSQANTWKTCRKQWAYRYVDGRKGIPSLPAVRGNRYHEAIEASLKMGSRPDNPILGRAVNVIARLGWEKVEPEKYLELYDETKQYKIRGYADVIGHKEDQDFVLDWKFPGKHPGSSPKKDYVDQIQLYGYMSGFNGASLILAYPEHDTAFTVEQDFERGKSVAESIFDAARQIDECGAKDMPGDSVDGSYNWSCREYCSHRDICPMGGK